MSGHEHLEALCAGGHPGQISSERMAIRLREHIEECSPCSEILGDFGKIGADLMA